MAGSTERLLYIDQKRRARDIVDRILDSILLKTTEFIDTGGTESNIPPAGPLVIGFAPHSGWIETIVIDRFLRKKREDHRSAVWITKKENENELPSWFT